MFAGWTPDVCRSLQIVTASKAAPAASAHLDADPDEQEVIHQARALHCSGLS